MSRREVSPSQLKQAIDAAPGLAMRTVSDRCCLCGTAGSVMFSLQREDGSVYMEFPVCLRCSGRHRLTQQRDPDPEHYDED